MNKLKALVIVYDLAIQNALDDIDPRDEELKKEENEQQEALLIVSNLIEKLRSSYI